MAQYIYTMNRVAKMVPPKRFIIKDISLSFFPGAKIGVLGLNGSGKSTLLRIMVGIDMDFDGEARPQPNIKIGYLPQEPELDAGKDVRGNVEEGVSEIKALLDRFNDISMQFAEPMEDEQMNTLLEDRANCRTRSIPPAAGNWIAGWMWPPMHFACRHGTRMLHGCRAAKGVALPCAACYCPSPICCCSTSRPITSTRNPLPGSNDPGRISEHRHRRDS